MPLERVFHEEQNRLFWILFADSPMSSPIHLCSVCHRLTDVE